MQDCWSTASAILGKFAGEAEGCRMLCVVVGEGQHRLGRGPAAKQKLSGWNIQGLPGNRRQGGMPGGDSCTAPRSRGKSAASHRWENQSARISEIAPCCSLGLVTRLGSAPRWRARRDPGTAFGQRSIGWQRSPREQAPYELVERCRHE